MAKVDEVVLSYHDALLHKSDFNLLQKGNWINDKIIGFMFEYFQREIFGEFSQIVCFLDADLVQLLKFSQPDEARVILSPLDIQSKKLLFLPINDNPDAASCGGSHWSLLVVNKDASIIEHYDSFSGGNYDVAKDMFSKICNIFSYKFQLEQMPVTQQTNGYDCGLYVIKIAEERCRSKLLNTKWNAATLNEDLISSERTRIRDLISNMSEKSKLTKT